MNIVFLDSSTIGDDIDISTIKAQGTYTSYPLSTPEEAAVRTRDADIIITNKVPMNEQTIGGSPNVKLICVCATGTDILDKEYLDKRGIIWKSVPAYSTDSVAQHTFAMLFYLMENLPYYDKYVKSGEFCASPIFTHFGPTFRELSQLTFGIIGLGAIGRKVAKIAEAFGAKVIYASASGGRPQEGYTMVSMDELYATSDIVSIHAPLNEHTRHLINKESLSKMKKSCIVLNLGRGPIICEEDLAWALDNDIIAGAGLDVVEKEPIPASSALLSLKNKDRLLVTPHIGWASTDARNRLMSVTTSQIVEFCQK